MALRDKLRDRVQPRLEPGEQIQEVYLAQTGPTPWLGLLTAFIWFAVKRRIVVATDRAIVVFSASWWTGTHPKELLGRLPRSTTVGPLSGLWAKSAIGGEKVHIHKRFHQDVARADHVAGNAVGGAASTDPAGGPGGGQSAGGQPLPPPGEPLG